MNKSNNEQAAFESLSRLGCETPGFRSQHLTRRVLAIVPYAPNRIRIRTPQVLRELIQYAEVDLVYLDDGAPLELPSGIRNVIAIPNASEVARAFRVLLGILRGRPITQEFYNSGRLRRVVANLDLDSYDAIYVERLPVHRYLKHQRVIYDCQDCVSRLTRLMFNHGKGYKRLLYGLDSLLLPRHERAACNAASVVVLSSHRDVADLRQLGVTTPIEVWTQVHGDDVPPRIPCERDRFVISFHGKLSYAANELALRVLGELIAPALDPSRYELRIIGRCPARFHKKFGNLKFTGFVPSIMHEIRKSDLSVFPVEVSTGFPNKAMESLAVGVPFIATQRVVDALYPRPDILEAGIYVRDITEFASTIEQYTRLSLSERQEISRRCSEYARKVRNLPSRQGQWKRILGSSFVVPDSSLAEVASE